MSLLLSFQVFPPKVGGTCRSILAITRWKKRVREWYRDISSMKGIKESGAFREAGRLVGVFGRYRRH